jgi:hypothetical protein
MIPTDVARVLAELVDTALADDWSEEQPLMALLWQGSEHSDDLRMAVKPLGGSVEDELAPLAGAGGYLAVAHSMVTRRPPANFPRQPEGAPLRITLAVDHASESCVLRHRNGATEWLGSVDLPLVAVIRSRLWLEAAC